MTPRRKAGLVSAALLAALAGAGLSGTAHAEGELERLWGDIWGHKKPAQKSAQPAPNAPAAPATGAPAAAASAPAPAAEPAPPAPAAQAAPAQAAAPSVPVVLPKVQAVSESLVVTGNADSVNTVKLVARVPGYLEQIHFQDGQIVRKGDALFTIQQDQYKDQLQQAQAQLLAATAARDHAHLEVGRYTALLQKHAAAQVEVDHWVYEEKAAEANVLGAQAQIALAKLNLGYTEVTAPFDGQMGRHLIDPNNMVGGDGGPPALAEIMQLDPIYVVANISSQQALQIRQNLDQRRLSLDDLHKIPIEAALSDETGFPHKGTIQYVAPQIDPQTGTLYVRGIVRNPDRTLLPGMFVNMRLPMGKVVKSALLVPVIALQEDQGGRYLFVVDASGIVQKRYVELGDTVGALQVATSGVGRDDRIVVGELWRVNPGMKVTPNPTTLGAVP
ncbi:efflux RND transporter periplasmic adaptor subunit [Roseiarcus fermentans]|nr:efflux RND transporter periplasmic adaptor subunit [Roseiarcus fermentans]